jgi:hypothetical protein
MKVKTNLKAGALTTNHNETLVHAVAKARGLKVKTHLKAGAGILTDPSRINHNETLVRAIAKAQA